VKVGLLWSFRNPPQWRRPWNEFYADQIEQAVLSEELGYDHIWLTEHHFSPDGYSPSLMPIAGTLAARTTRMTLGTGILQITARTPSMTAMTALSLASLSGNRFVLGLGASGPQVVEGLHGESFRKPLARMREVIGILRQAFCGRPLTCEGEHYVLPRPGGEGKALRLSQPPNPGLPIWLATLSPRALELTGELADGWLGTSFTPEHAEAHLAHLRRGAAKGVSIMVSSKVSGSMRPMRWALS